MIILDTSVLSAYTRVEQLHNIKELFKEVAIPQGVYEEYQKRWSPKKLPSWITVIDVENQAALNPILGRGESQAITLAKKHDCILALDDEKARKAARRMGIPLIGSLGILRLTYEKCHIDNKLTLKALLQKLEEDLYIEEWLKNWVLEAEKPRKT